MSDTTKDVPVVRIRCSMGVTPPRLHCPRTGNVVMGGDEEEGEPPSPYVTFIYPYEVGDFVYLREDLEERLEAARQELIDSGTDEDDLPDNIEILLEHTDLGEVPLLYEITTRSMACGPVDSTVVVGFNLWSEEDEECDEEESEDE